MFGCLRHNQRECNHCGRDVLYSEALLCQNSVRVVKTVRQTYETPISYSKAIASVVEKDGVLGLFGRGLQTRLIANGMQGLMFTGTSIAM